MHTTLGPAVDHDYDEPARPSWMFQKRAAVQAEKAEAGEIGRAHV